jgi:hypothetical protein
MKFTSVLLFTFLGLLTAVAALPLSAIHPHYDTSHTQLEERFVDENDPIFARYFGGVSTPELSERDYADGVVEPRQYAEAGKFIAEGVMKIIELIKGKIEQDKKMRGEWTNHMIGEFRKKYPHFNFVLCHTSHKTDFKGVRGKDWGHSHQELPVSFSKTIGYEIYWFKEGTFHRQGDGGWLNWAYAGNVKKTSDGGKTVVFGPI